MDSSLELKAVCVVHQPIQNGIGQGVVTNAGVPLISGYSRIGDAPRF